MPTSPLITRGSSGPLSFALTSPLPCDTLGQLDTGNVREVPVRGRRVPSSLIVPGAAFDCWFPNQEQWFPASVQSTTKRATVIVTFVIFFLLIFTITNSLAVISGGFLFVHKK